MSNDRYENIRQALAMGPTPGPWCVLGDGYGAPYVSTSPPENGSRRWNGQTICLLYEDCTQFDSIAYGSCLEALRNAKANASFIAACDPDTIRALLAERDELAKDAARYRWLRKGESDDVAVVRGLGATDYGMSGVVSTYSEEVNGDDLDAAIDRERGEGERK